MRKLKIVDQLREHGIFNPHNFVMKFGKRNVDDYVISYSAPDRASAPRSLIWSPHRKLAPKGHWQDYGAQSFVGTKRSSRPEAIAWATKHLKIAAWVPCPADTSALVPKTVRDHGLTWLKELGVMRLCPVCGDKITVTGRTKDGRAIGSCGDAFEAKDPTRDQPSAGDRR